MKPLLALSKVVTPQQVPLPTLASIKSDGIRGCAVDGQIWSRNEILIPNRYVQSELKGLHGIDGELLLRDGSKDFNDQQSAFMSIGGQPDFDLLIFDYWDSPLSFVSRSKLVRQAVVRLAHHRLLAVQQVLITTVEELVTFYNEAVAAGHEGLICRDPNGKYKHGRSTLNQALSLKLKPAKHAEAQIIGIEPLVDQAGVVHAMLGKFNVIMNGKRFNIGTGEGLTHDRRREFWENREELKGLSLSFQYYELSKYGVPRSPSWRGIRYE